MTSPLVMRALRTRLMYATRATSSLRTYAPYNIQDIRQTFVTVCTAGNLLSSNDTKLGSVALSPSMYTPREMMSTVKHVLTKSKWSNIARQYGENAKLRTKTTTTHKTHKMDWRKGIVTVEETTTNPILRTSSTPESTMAITMRDRVANKLSAKEQRQPIIEREMFAIRTFPPVAALLKPVPDKPKIAMEPDVVEAFHRDKVPEDIKITQRTQNP
eukprot:7141838-Prymnesium_polylepis.1